MNDYPPKIGCSGCNCAEGERHKDYCPEIRHGGLKIDSLWIDEAKNIPDVMIGVEVPAARAFNRSPCEAEAARIMAVADETRARPATPENNELSDDKGAENGNSAHAPGSDEYALYAHRVIVSAFKHLLDKGYDAVEVNAVAIGMCRRSMEELVGKKNAMEWDRMARDRCGWGKAKIIYPGRGTRQ